MRTYVVAGLAVASLFVASAALAQDTSKSNLGVDAAVLLPVGNMSDATSVMLGGMLRFEYPVQPEIAITGRAGYLYGLNKTISLGPFGNAKYGISDIPIWAGAKYYFGGDADGAYGAAELGLNMLSFRIDLPAQSFGGVTVAGGSTSDSQTKFGANIGAGYKIDALDIRAEFSMLDLGHAGDTMGILATVGYNFAQF